MANDLLIALRPELTTLPARLQSLPIDDRGYPVPWFVDWQDGKPEFRAMNGQKWGRAVREKRCWICGQPLGIHLAFPIGPMCVLNRTISEPPSHYACAEWSVRNCPFLSRPHMVRREDDQINEDVAIKQSGGCAITRNPGVVCLWVTRSYRVFKSSGGSVGQLIQIGEPERVEWFAAGRSATRAEVIEAIDSGLPLLRQAAQREDSARDVQAAFTEIARRREQVEMLFPCP